MSIFDKLRGKSRDIVLPGMSNGGADVYERGATRKQDSRFRNLYETPERGNKPKASSYAYVPIGTALAGLTVVGVTCFLAPTALSAVTTALSSNEFFSVQPLSFGEAVKAVLLGGWYSSLSYAFMAGSTLIAHAMLKNHWKTQNIGAIHTDIDHYEDDAYIQHPLELPFNFDVFPDAGAHSPVAPTAVLAHMMLDTTGLKKVMTKDGMKPIVDKSFGDKLFTTSFIPEGKEGEPLRVYFDATKVYYNPKNAYGKLEAKTLADHINKYWSFPDYEVQRPAGVYIVDTEPNNTMVLAMTRAGKGQTIIEPTIDLWTREDYLNNMAINDPKGELYVRFYYPATQRGLDVVCFNLMNPARTNIYNPLGYAVDAARQGDNQKVEELVASIGDVFFSTENSDDPMWNNAANAAFKRSALGLIDYYQEEEAEMRQLAVLEGTSEEVLEQRLDEMWGRVTLYNVYKMMTELASKKSNDESFIHLDSDDPSEEKDYLTLFFDATNKLPRNALRTSVANQDDSLRAMAGSDKTIASVYGISLTAMLFFADEKISRLTSGRPSQNFDMIGLAFPRRVGVRFDSNFLRSKNLRGQPLKWTAYQDEDFTERYEGDDFEHEGRIDSNGWCMFFFKGIFKEEYAYLKLEIFDERSGTLAYTYYFEFKIGYKKSLKGRTYVYDPVHKERIRHNGVLREMVRVKGSDTFEFKQSTRRRIRKSLSENGSGEEIHEYVSIFDQTEVKYTEKPKAIFFVTPPHLMTYAKIILILLNQMFNMQVDKAYLTKANQKPLHKTRYMLDEVGNLQSEGSGIPGLNTKESIGLGQEQQYTLILQTLQQLKDVYGDSVDKILQGNTGNIIYLKSTDDSMLATLESMSGKRHVAYTDSKTVTQDTKKLFNSTEGNVSYTTSMKEIPTITKEQMLFIPKCNAMVFGKGFPIWARNEMAMPMAHMLHRNQLCDPNKPKYELNTVPTTSNTDDFDVLANKPNFIAMVAKRVAQAKVAESVRMTYQRVYGYSDDEMSRIIPEELSKELMMGIQERLTGQRKLVERIQAENDMGDDAYDFNEDDYDMASPVSVIEKAMMDTAVETDVMKYAHAGDAVSRELATVRYANYQISRTMLGARVSDYQSSDGFAHANLTVSKMFVRNKSYDGLFADVYMKLRPRFEQAQPQFKVENGSLYGQVQGQYELFIQYNGHALQQLVDTASDDTQRGFQFTPDSTVTDTEAFTPAMQYQVQDAFVRYLVSLDSWGTLLQGEFEKQVINLYPQYM